VVIARLSLTLCFLFPSFFFSSISAFAQTQSVITRESSFTYDSGSGLLTSETVEPNATGCNGTGAPTSSCGVTTTYQYDSFGNKISAQVSGAAIASRTTTASYLANGQGVTGQFKTGVTNALNQSESYIYSASFGVAVSHTGPNGVTTTWAYDTFGRQQSETRADGTKTNVTYAYCAGVNGGTATCPTNGAFLKQVMPVNSSGTQIGPTAIVYYDALSRAIGTSTQGFDGGGSSQTILTTVQYNANGQVAQASRPYFSGNTPKWTSNSYDALGRPTQTTMPNGGYVSYAYNGLSTSTTNDHNQTTNTVNNAQGLKASVTDAAGNTTFYAYDAEGDLLTLTDANGNVTTNTYDLRGRKIQSSDPDMGTWTYAYDVLGELVGQHDAKNSATAMAYDGLGRMVSRAEGTFTSNWIYDTGNYAVGKLVESCTSSSNNPTCTSPLSSKSFTYDQLGRPSTTTLMVSATSYTYTTQYDGNGRVQTVTYPSGFVAKYVYTTLSYVSQIVDSASGTAYWTANARDAEQHLLQATAGNGIVTNQVFDPNTGLVEQITAGASNAVANFSYNFDTLGNLTSRSDTVEGTVENFCYDALNRVTNYALGGSSCTTGTSGLIKTVAYDALGNITSKSDVGSYGYGSGAGPHAVTFISGTVNGVINPNFVYDANGNMTSGDGRTVTYTSFNMAATVTQGSTTLTLTYDSEHARITEVSPTGTTTYLNDPSSGAMSELFLSGAVTTWRDYIKADGKLIAVRFNQAGTVTMGYFTLDHLGSISVITDQNGAIVERDSYDAWGRRRNANGTDAVCGANSSETTRGFTGQEEMDQVCLVNMNARLYDPTIGRFMQADSVVQDAFDSQALNRYTYVRNNPLSFTDPTGHLFGIDDLIAAIVIIVSEAVADVAVAAEAWFVALPTVFQGAIIGGALGGIQAGIKGGNILKGILVGGISGAVFAEAGGALGNYFGGQLSGVVPFSGTIGHFIGYGLVGGIMSVAQGGKFGPGFLAAGVGGAVGFNTSGPFNPGNLIISAVAGGVSSVLGGGKFANGAEFAAFAYVVGTCASGGCSRPNAVATEDATATGVPSNAIHVNAAINMTQPYTSEEDALDAAQTGLDQAGAASRYQWEYGVFTVKVGDLYYNSFIETSEWDHGVVWDNSKDFLEQNDVYDYSHLHVIPALGFGFSTADDIAYGKWSSWGEPTFHGFYNETIQGSIWRLINTNGGENRCTMGQLTAC
jgi:RHS repeat-associated protein